MFKIGVFSKMNKVTVKTLRYYDEIGLLCPSHVDETTGYRYYSGSQLPRLHRILALKQIGFSLNEIITAMAQEASTAEMIKQLEAKQEEISQNIEYERKKLMQVQSYLKILEQEALDMGYNVVLKELPEVIVASMRRIVPNYDTFNEIYPEMGAFMQEQKVKCTTPGYCFTLYHDGEYKEADIDVEICEAVIAPGKDSDKIKFKKLDSVPTAACVIHKGPYNTIGLAYSAVTKWIEENGYTVTEQPRESYIEGIWNKENPEEWITEIQVPVKANS